MSEVIALYKCQRCQHAYKGKPGPTECPNCKNLYVRWVNYEQTFG